ncbi:MAG: matrixin family metalloprotease [Pseudomonadota bacterium]|nr:matrixin family metalloprotease [Pseudomonadota bacterium]
MLYAVLLVVAGHARAAEDVNHKYRSLAPGLHWSGNTMSWYYAPAGEPAWASGTSAVTLIQQAMNVWSSRCGVQFSYLGTTPQQATVQDGASIIGWLPTMSNAGNTSWYMRAGTMTEADVQLNASANGTAVATYPMILHELGHAIGLDHSEVAQSVMAGPPVSAAYSYATTLADDDIAGCQALYGPPASAPGATQVAASCGPQPSASSRVSACSAGMVGQIQEQEVFACTAGTWSSAGFRVVQNTCAAAPATVAADAVALEYYHPALDHYFMTADVAEQATLANGGFDGQWRATGVRFPVWKLAYPNMQPMCRFYGDPTIDPVTGKPRGPNSHFYTAIPAECASVPKKYPVWMFEGYTFFAALPDANGTCPVGTQAVYRYFRPQGDPNHRYVTTEAGKREMQSRGWVAEGVTWCAGT